MNDIDDHSCVTCVYLPSSHSTNLRTPTYAVVALVCQKGVHIPTRVKSYSAVIEKSSYLFPNITYPIADIRSLSLSETVHSAIIRDLVYSSSSNPTADCPTWLAPQPALISSAGSASFCQQKHPQSFRPGTARFCYFEVKCEKISCLLPVTIWVPDFIPFRDFPSSHGCTPFWV